MENVKVEEVKRGRGRPKLDAHITEEYAPSRRQALNKMYSGAAGDHGGQRRKRTSACDRGPLSAGIWAENDGNHGYSEPSARAGGGDGRRTWIKEFENGAKSLSAQAEAASRESVDEIRELARKSDEECGELAAKIDEVFGDGASRKIFGERTPGLYELADFFGQIGALIKKYGDERVEKYKEKYAKYDRKEG